MPIKFYLQPNSITPDPNDQVARVSTNVTLTEEGIYLTHEAGAQTKVTELAIRTDSKLMFTIPAGLATGGYQVEVRKGYGKLASTRTGMLQKQLEIV